MKSFYIPTFFFLAIFLNAHSDIPGKLEFEAVFQNLSFKRPIDFVIAPDNEKVAYVVEQRGKVWKMPFDNQTTEKTLVFDIAKRLGHNNEEGLLDMAFHPDYPKTNKIYFYYSQKKPRQSVIASFAMKKTR